MSEGISGSCLIGSLTGASLGAGASANKGLSLPLLGEFMSSSSLSGGKLKCIVCDSLAFEAALKTSERVSLPALYGCAFSLGNYFSFCSWKVRRNCRVCFSTGLNTSGSDGNTFESWKQTCCLSLFETCWRAILSISVNEIRNSTGSERLTGPISLPCLASGILRASSSILSESESAGCTL